jgi:hypothetical protein
MRLRETDDHVTYLQQLQDDDGPVILINQFNVAPEGRKSGGWVLGVLWVSVGHRLRGRRARRRRRIGRVRPGLGGRCRRRASLDLVEWT